MNAYLSKSWETVHGMIDAFFVLLPKLILAIVVFVLLGEYLGKLGNSTKSEDGGRSCGAVTHISR